MFVRVINKYILNVRKENNSIWAFLVFVTKSKLNTEVKSGQILRSPQTNHSFGNKSQLFPTKAGWFQVIRGGPGQANFNFQDRIEPIGRLGSEGFQMWGFKWPSAFGGIHFLIRTYLNHWILLVCLSNKIHLFCHLFHGLRFFLDANFVKVPLIEVDVRTSWWRNDAEWPNDSKWSFKSSWLNEIIHWMI